MEEQDEFEKLLELFQDDVFDDLLTKALLVGAEQVREDDLWMFTPSTMVRRSLLDAVCKNERLLPEFLSILSEDRAALVTRFLNLRFEHEHLAEDEKVALQELVSTYANDVWVWAKDALSETEPQEFPGSDLKGFSEEEITDAIIRLLATAWV